VSEKRVERDFLGEVEVPASAYYGSFTARALRNFRISGQTIGEDFIRAIAEAKKAAAGVNAELGLLDGDLADAIARAADEVIAGRFAAEFLLDVFQAGAGTPWNMNANEVIANRANELLGHPLGSYSPIHPNDHVNMSQSSNDVIPTAIRVAALRRSRELTSNLVDLGFALEVKAVEFRGVLKSGRTHLRDAVPVTLGQEFHTYAVALGEARSGIEDAEEKLSRLPLGGTAVGTGVDTHPRFRDHVIRKLGEITGLDLTPLEDSAYGLQFPSDFLAYMNALGVLATTLIKVGNDLMLLSSGPATGLGEMTLPAVEPGSSIMPGKVNPSVIECVNMVCLQTIGCRAAVEAAAQQGNLDLNVYTPLVANNLLSAQRWMANAVDTLRARCIVGIEANPRATRYYFEHSNAFATLLTPILGYEAASRLAIEAAKKGVTVGKLAVEKELISEENLVGLAEGSTAPNLGNHRQWVAGGGKR
jgi:aspartate ammonia-lyase